MQTNFYWWIYAPLFIILGLLMLNAGFYKKMIDFGNKLRGVKTEITGTTMNYGKFLGIFFLIIGVIFLLLALMGESI